MKAETNLLTRDFFIEKYCFVGLLETETILSIYFINQEWHYGLQRYIQLFIYNIVNFSGLSFSFLGNVK